MKGNKPLELDKGSLENDEFRRCRQTQCGFFLNGGCRECRDCKAKPFIIRKSCNCCDNCENTPGYLRFGDGELEKEQNELLKQQEQEGIILIYNDKASPEHIRQEEEMLR